MRWLARTLRCTEGQAYTVVTALVLAIVLTAFTVSGVVNHHPPAAVKPIPFKDFSGSDTAAPLTIEESGFAGATPGHGAVPKQGLPVAADAGAVTQLSFVRLSGQARVLHLNAEPAKGATPSVVMCPIQSETWVPAREIATAAAPPYDCATSAPGIPKPDGTWSFDLGGFTDRASSKGFVLVPAPGAAATFSVTFLPVV